MSYSAPASLAHRHSIDRLSDEYSMFRASSLSAAAWPSANLALYIPVVVRHSVLVRKLWFANGSTGTGNYDIGLYDDQGAALLRRGSTAKPGSSVEIVWDCTDTPIGPGIYYLALASDSASDTFNRAAPAAPLAAALNVLGETAFPLPSTASWATQQTLAYVPVVGLFLDTVTS